MTFNKSFRIKDSNDQRFDGFEGAKSNYFFEKGILQVRDYGTDDDWKTVNITNTHLNEFYNTADIYSYSLYMITYEDLKETSHYRIDSAMSKLGPWSLIIRNPTTFLDNVKAYLDSHEFDYFIAPISYHDNSKNRKDLTLFDKTDSYSHQKELRIIVKAKSTQPLKFNIGKLAEYSELHESIYIVGLEMRL